MLSLVAALLAASPSCALSTDGGTMIDCGDARVIVSLAPGAPSEAMPGVLEGMTKFYAATEMKKAEVALGGQTRPATEVTIFASAKEKTAIGHALVTATPEKDAKALSRVLVCFWELGRPLESCTRGFEQGLTIANPKIPRPSLPAAEPRAWTGLPLTTPEGCKAPEPGNIECQKAAILWGDRPSQGPLNSRKLLAQMTLQQFPPGAKETERACRIGGKADSCSVIVATVKGITLTVVLGLGEVKERSTSFQCMVRGELKGPPPPPCDQLVTW